MRYTSFVVLCLALCITAGGLCYAQGYEEEVAVRLLEVWANVTDSNGKVVPDLTPEDFKVFVDGKPADVRCFEKVIQPDYTASIDMEAPEDLEKDFEPPKRRFIFFFDMLTSPTGDMNFLKGELARFIHDSFEDQDEGMAFALVPTAKLGVVQHFTNNKEALIDVVSRLKGNPSGNLDFYRNQRELVQLLYTGGGQGEMGTLITSQQIKQARSMTRQFALEEQRKARLVLESFKSVADYLSGPRGEGRLVLIYVGGGFPLIPGDSYYEMLNRAMETTGLGGPEDRIYRDYPDFDFIQEIKKAIGHLNRMNVTIYTIDTKGLIEGDKGVQFDGTEAAGSMNQRRHDRNSQDSIVLIAKETGGLAFTNSQNFQLAANRIANDINEQYFLCATLPESKKRGSYRKIEVKVDRAGVNVRHRQGYIE